MIKIITNDQGSGDWITVMKDDQYLFEGHYLMSFDLEDILRSLGHEVSLISVTDEQMEEGDF